MDVLLLFAKGLVIGLAVAAPVGPIGVLCIHRTIWSGRLIGFVSGLGAAVADSFYGAVAAFGLTAISDFLLAHQFWLRAGGGVFLCYLAIRTVTSRQVQLAPSEKKAGAAMAFSSTVLLTVANPSTIISFAAIFAGVGLVSEGLSHGHAALMVVGVFLGSALWWLTLSGIAGLLHGRRMDVLMPWINRLSAAVIGGFGVVVLLSLL
jgi:threonine/homoserine/homoserine lactone efflux protein